MEKILERYILDDVFKVIDKHIGFHQEELENIKVKSDMMGVLFPNDTDDTYDMERLAHASAIASLMLLKNELKGEKEY